MNVRKIALTLLSEYEQQGKYVNLSLSSHLTDGLSEEDRSFLTALLYTTVEKKITYDYYIAALSGRSVDKIDSRTLNILRLGMCQLVDMDKIPDFAAVNESVKLASNSGARSFINGVLRAAVRNKSDLPLPPREKNIARHFSVKYSFPQKLVKRFINILGEDGAEKLLLKFSEISPTDITVNTVKITREEYSRILLENGIENTPSPYSDIGLRIERSIDPRLLPGYDEGLFFVQDASCAAAISVLSPQKGESIADVCACPGGKSFAAAVMMGDEGRIFSFDIHESKLSLINDSAKRLGFSSISASVRDANTPDCELVGKMDAVICDVPCSGLGVLGKKADVRYKDEGALSALPELQLSILSASATYLKRGGRLLYSTCTLNSDENEAVVAQFLDKNPSFRAREFSVGEYSSCGGMLTLYPHIHNTDGFFIALIEKTEVE